MQYTPILISELSTNILEPTPEEVLIIVYLIFICFCSLVHFIIYFWYNRDNMKKTWNKQKTERLGKWFFEADPVNCTDPEKLPAGFVAEVVLDTAIFLQTPKGDPACKDAIFISIICRVSILYFIEEVPIKSKTQGSKLISLFINST